MTGRHVAIAVVLHEGRALVGRRADDATEEPGRAEFPGGKIEPHEVSAAAACRECLEETGIAIRILAPTYEVAAGPGTPRLTFHWAAPIDAGVPPRQPFAWVAIEELSRLPFPSANAPVVAILQRQRATPDQGGS